jgi:hypothetical protein
MNTATPLEYAPVTRRKSRWKWIQRILLLIVALSASGWIYHNRDDISLRVRRVYWCYRCMHHITPPGTVLVESDPARMAALLANNPDYVLDGTQYVWPGVHVKVASSGPKQAVYWPMEWRQLMQVDRMSTMDLGTDAICFLGQRTSHSGHTRLVAVRSATCNALDLAPLDYTSRVIVRPDVFGNLPQGYQFGYDYSGRWVKAELSPGIADPADLSHISIDFVVGDANHPRHGTIDIYLCDNDTLDIHIRDPATTRGL